MSIKEINAKVDQLNTTWNDFKSLNDRSDSSDPLVVEQLQKIQRAMSTQQAEIERMRMSLQRPSLSMHASPEIGAEQHQYKKAFSQYLRKGADKDLCKLNSSAYYGSQLGYMASSTLVDQVNNFLYGACTVRRISKVSEISLDSLELIEDKEGVQAGWFHEIEADLNDNNKNAFTPSKRSIFVHELCAQPKITQRLLDDPKVDAEKWIGDKLCYAFASKESHSFVRGDGNSKPKGFLTYPDGTDWGQIKQVQASGDLDADKLKELFFALDARYAMNGTFLAHRSTVHKLRTLKQPNASGKHTAQGPQRPDEHTS